MKIMFIDTETTGLHAEEGAEIIQFSAICEEDGKAIAAVNIMMRPSEPTKVDPAALRVQNRTLEEVCEWPSRKKGFEKILAFFDKCCDKYDKEDKMYFTAYNAGFDKSFVNALFKENKHKYLFSYFYPHPLDVMAMSFMLKMAGAIDVPNIKQTTIAEALKIEVTDEHDAMGDVRVMRDIFHKIDKVITVSAL